MFDAALPMTTDDAPNTPDWQAPWIERCEFVVPASNLPRLKDKIEKLNRRARRLGCSPIVISVGAGRTVEKTQQVMVSGGPDTSRKIRVKCHDVVVSGERPKLPGGWRLLARVQLLDGVSITHTVPGETVPAEFHNAHNRCDHCRVNRTRNDVYVVGSGFASDASGSGSGFASDASGGNKAAKLMAVGSTCISDFLGGVSPTQMAWYAEALAALDCREYEEYDGGFGGGEAASFDVEAYMVASATAIRLGGWIARSAVKYSGGPSTSDHATLHYRGKLRITPQGDLTSEIRGRWGADYPLATTIPADETTAREAIAWAQAINPEIANDYLINVHKVADLSFAPWNLAGIAASIVSAYQREQGRLATRARETSESKHVGTIGERSTFRLTVAHVNTIDGTYGTTHIHTMRDAAGNVFKWFASRECLDQGRTYDVTGTIKKHGDYKGTAETTLTRCKAT